MDGRVTTCVSALFLATCLTTAVTGWAAEREHFQFKIGAAYDEGDFGTPTTTRTVFVPVTLRYLGDRFDLGVTGSFVHFEAAEGVTLIEGIAAQIAGEEGVVASETGVGDTVVKGRVYLLDDPGPGSPVPGLTPFVKVKIPTADEDKNLGTGETDYGFGLEFDKQFGPFFLFGDVSYTVIGDPPGRNLRNRPAASVGAGAELSQAISLSALIDWRRSLVAGIDDPVELVGTLSFRRTRTTTVSPYVFVGLSDGSPDFGVGFELSYRFGRY
ncbi:MAG: hypothetical protein ACE5HK_00335 [Candidatus Methylomirabilales bacterium]